ncbi:blue (type 1) copper domain protein [Thermaerobacter marianensis DSM 12885]|uniref:Blue (Type 1) copper domain protein n=1 Tax=Thermaerobacter marianensis (strain ATCC 700841 / DSM 12885 / JCM 10246 / 7p75a) TaxID=644966 RepID=E6SH96_THEM7|nr:cupredoxin domain-containing protein [Thermaerobacter marianensis]ADU51760.1 blue (type 1) copper domain protein [Thermaerobacter marianensis DSM 12885]
MIPRPVPAAPTRMAPAPRRRSACRLAAVLAAASLLAAGCTPRSWGPRTLTVAMTPDFAFQPRELAVKPGETVRIVLINRDDRLPHELRSGGRLGPDLRLAPGERREWQWTAPAEPGAIVFWCGMPGHRKNGMAGRVVVRASP